MKKILSVILICAIILFSTGCIDKAQVEEQKSWQTEIAELLDYDAEVTCWANTSGGTAVNIKPLNQNADSFGNNIICGVRATHQVLGNDFSTLTIGYADDDGTVIFTAGDDNYGFIMDGHTEQVYQYDTESDLSADYPSVTEYLELTAE